MSAKLSTRLMRNTAANYAGRFLAFAVALFLTPFVINSLGDTRYGVWALLLSVSGYLALLDLGLANALAKYTAEYAAHHDQETVSQMASSLFFAFAGAGLVAFGAMVWLSFHFAEIFGVPVGEAGAAQAALVILGLNLGLGLPLSVYNAVMVGYQRYDLLNAAVSIGWLLQAGLTVVVLTLGWDLVGLAAVTCTITVTRALLLRWLLERQGDAIRLRPSLVRKALLRMLVSYSVFMFVMLACRRVEEATGPVIVGRLVSLEAVTTYAVGVKVGRLLAPLAIPVTVALFPAFSELDALADRGGLGRLLTQGLRVSALVGMPVAGLAIVLVQPLISLWVGPQHLDSAGIGTAMLLRGLTHQLLLAASSLLQGTGRLKLYMVLHLGAVIVSIGLGLVLVQRWGGLGVAVGSLVAWGLVLAVTIPHTAQIAEIGTGTLLRVALAKPLLATLVTCTALFGVCRLQAPANLLQLALYGSAAGLLYLTLVWGLCLDAGERRRLVGYAGQFLGRAVRRPAPGETPLEDLS